MFDFPYRYFSPANSRKANPWRFRPQQFNRWTWLCYSMLYDGAFCLCFVLFGKEVGHNGQSCLGYFIVNRKTDMVRKAGKLQRLSAEMLTYLFAYVTWYAKVHICVVSRSDRFKTNRIGLEILSFFVKHD